jgi:DHA3 family macrolide efflux protein-like MFS transporter
MIQNEKPGEMRTFTIVWFGQLISLVGSGMTSIALSMWIYQQSGSVTQFAFINLAAVLPRILISPLAGVLVDRWDRRMVMVFSDSLSGLTTLGIALLYATGRIELWHIYIAVGLSAVCNTFQWPAFMAAMTLLVPKVKLGRANGMLTLNQAAAEIFSPLIAGALILTLALSGILLIDFATFLFAVTTLLFTRFPSPGQLHWPSSPADKTSQSRSVWREAMDGLKFIATRKGLLGLVVFTGVVFFLWGILGFTTEDVLGLILSIAGLGMFLGGVVMSAWGGPSHKVYGVVGPEMFSGLCFILIGLKPIPGLVAAGAFLAHTTIAIVEGSNQAIWQVKVPPEIQGRVFGTQQMVTRATTPLAYLLVGPLADKVFEPMLTVNGILADSLGQLVGVGIGRGIGLMFVLMGFIKIAVSAWGFINPHIREIEEILTDVVE